MRGFVAILEDDVDRVVEMKSCLAQVLPAADVVVFERADDMIAWLKGHLGEAVLISLDHDLPMVNAEGMLIDCGDGRMVADYLAELPATCPVIVHSSNANRAPGMWFALKDAGWQISRVVPYEDYAWIRGEWMSQVLQLIRDGWIVA